MILISWNVIVFISEQYYQCSLIKHDKSNIGLFEVHDWFYGPCNDWYFLQNLKDFTAMMIRIYIWTNVYNRIIIIIIMIYKYIDALPPISLAHLMVKLRIQKLQ